MADAEGADEDEGDGAGDTIEDLFAAVEHGRIDDVARLRYTFRVLVDVAHDEEHVL